MDPNVEDRFAALERRDAMQTRALRMLLEGRLEGASGAAGQVIALEGGQTTIDVQLGKSSPT